MLMPKKDRVAIHEALFTDGVLVAEKKYTMNHHPLIAVPNLYVCKALQSLKSRGYVKEQYSWRHYYWYLTNEGIQYLRDYLHLPPEIVPSTLKRQARTEAARPRARDTGRATGDIRRGAPGSDKKADAGAGAADPSAVQFRGGFGRGRPTGDQ